MRVSLQPSYILHHRHYRETSLLLDVLTEEYGRIALIARGARGKQSRLRPILQPFVPLLLSWQGKTDLFTLTAAESHSSPLQLHGDCLLSGFYLNELLVRILQKQDPHPALYTIYQQTLLELQVPVLQEKTLRLFEKNLLEALGYGISLCYDFSTGKNILEEGWYQFYPELGFKQIDNPTVGSKTIFKGKNLLALAAETLEDRESLRDAKQLMRLAFASLLGMQPLQSRKLFNTSYTLKKKSEEEMIK